MIGPPRQCLAKVNVLNWQLKISISFIMSGFTRIQKFDIACGVPDAELLEALLQDSAARHRHLCPRQVLGVRIGLSGLRILGLNDKARSKRFRNQNKSLLTIAETDGCGSDGIAVATDCSVGRRTLRVLDYGKVAATLVDTVSKRAVRLAPTSAARQLAISYAPDSKSPWHGYLKGYQLVPDELLLKVEYVKLTRDIEEILSKPGLRVNCERCHEEIMNEREVIMDGLKLCRSCAGDRYYRITSKADG